MTRHHPIENDTFAADTFAGAAISANGKTIRVVGGHLDYVSYGPYAAQNKEVTKESQIQAGEEPSGSRRVDNVKDLLKNKRFQQWVLESDKIPLFLCGDFNAASHLDYVESTK